MSNGKAQSGFSAVEAMVSLAVLSVAMVGFLGAMTAATKVSNEELAEGDMQAETRKLTEELCRDMDSASICYIHPWGQVNLGAPILTNDTDNSNNSFLLLRYQFSVVGNDPNDLVNFGKPGNPIGTASQNFGATPPGASVAVPGACYTLVFKRDQRQQFIKEVDPATNPAAVAGTKYIYKDLDGDGAYTTTWVVGHIERRYSPGFSAATPTVTSITDPVEKEYTSVVLLEWDAAANSPKNTIFQWLEFPGSSSSTSYNQGNSVSPLLDPCGWNDNCGHIVTATTGKWMPVRDLTGAPGSQYPNNAIDTTGNNQWDPIMSLSLRFLVAPDDGRLGNSGTRMKIASTSMFLRNQNKGN